MIPNKHQREMPYPTKREARAEQREASMRLLVEILERLVRVESKLSKLCLDHGLDENGYPRPDFLTKGASHK